MEVGAAEQKGNCEERGGSRPAPGWSALRAHDLYAISPLSTGVMVANPLGATRRRAHKQWVIGTKVPASPERRRRQEGRGRDGRSDLHRQAMRRSFGFKSDQPDEAPEEPVFLARNAVSLGTQATRKRASPRRAAVSKRNPSSDWDFRAASDA